ncbi:MAG: hypothetical protein R2836_06915 [Chitinophagales bacterium]
MGRYVNFNNPHGNSPVLEGNTLYAGSNNPDIEDLNRDNSLNETEQYFQYAIDMYPGMNVDNHPYIVSVSEFGPDDFFDEQQLGWKWYQFRIPIHEYTSKVEAYRILDQYNM